MRRSAAALAALVLALVAGLGAMAGAAPAQDSFSGWRGGPIKIGSGFRFTDGSDRVREVQRHLRALGYTLSGEDGKFGAQTDRAVRRFQNRRGLTVNGIVGVRTIRELRAVVAAREEAAARDTGGSGTPRDGDDGSGSGGDAISGGGASGTGGGDATSGGGTSGTGSGDATSGGGTSATGKDAPGGGAASPPPAEPRDPAPAATSSPEPLPAGVVIGVALVLAALAVGAVLLVRSRFGGGRDHGLSGGDSPEALSERIAAMRAAGLSPQDVADRLRAEREGGTALPRRGPEQR